MLLEPNCSKRDCVNYRGILQDKDKDGRYMEETERPACTAYPDGIPDEIAYGKVKHLKPYEGDNGIQYEKDKED